MKFLVKTLPKAEADIHVIARYIARHSRRGAAAWINAFDRARLRLADHAAGCSDADENEHFDIDVKQMFFKTRRGRTYRILFVIVHDEVRILRVRGPGQACVEPEDL